MSESRGFPDGLDEECDEKRGVKDDFNMFDPNSGNYMVTTKQDGIDCRLNSFERKKFGE